MKVVLLSLLSCVLISPPKLLLPLQEAQSQTQEQEQAQPPQQEQPELRISTREPERSTPSQPDEFEPPRTGDVDRFGRYQPLEVPNRFGIDPITQRAARRRVTPHLAPIMQHDSEFDLQSIPLAEWLSAKEVTQIPWKIDVDDPSLRMDQRLEVAYTAKIQSKHLNRLHSPELFFITGVSRADGEWLAHPKVVHQTIEREMPDDVELWFSDWVFTRPGDYILWFVLYEHHTGQYSVDKHRIQISPLENDPFPHASDGLPMVELPGLSDRDGGTVVGVYGGLTLPVQNTQKVRVQLISILSPPEQWSDQRNIIRSHSAQTVATVNTLSQMRLASGSISITGLDVIRRQMPFQQEDSEPFNWKSFVEALQQSTDNQIVSTTTLQGNKNGGAFFRDSLGQRLANSEDALRVLIVVTSSLLFERGSDLQPLKVEGDCNCRVYHLRFRHGINDSFDDVDKLLKSLRPRTFNVTSPRDLRKALAGIIKDLEAL